MKLTRDTVAMLREQAAHPNAEGWSEIAPVALRTLEVIS